MTISSLQNKLNFWWLWVRLINHLKRIKDKWDKIQLSDFTKEYNSHIPEKNKKLENYYTKQWFIQDWYNWYYYI